MVKALKSNGLEQTGSKGKVREDIYNLPRRLFSGVYTLKEELPEHDGLASYVTDDGCVSARRQRK